MAKYTTEFIKKVVKHYNSCGISDSVRFYNINWTTENKIYILIR